MDKQELKSIISEEREMYLGSKYSYLKSTKSKRFLIWKYLSVFRMAQYYQERIYNSNRLNSFFAKLFYRHYIKQKNMLSWKSGVEISNGCKIGRRLDIWHSGVVINCSLGDDCVFHGNNIVGNKGMGKSDEIPVLGNRVDIGAGAVIIGRIEIADDCIVGANAVVTKSFTEAGTIIVGIPGTGKYSSKKLN